MNASEYLDYKRQRREITASYHAGFLLFALGTLFGTIIGITIVLQVMV